MVNLLAHLATTVILPPELIFRVIVSVVLKKNTWFKSVHLIISSLFISLRVVRYSEGTTGSLRDSKPQFRLTIEPSVLSPSSFALFRLYPQQEMLRVGSLMLTLDFLL